MRRAYYIGEAVTITGTFTTDEGDLADPDVVTFRVLTPSKVVVPLTPTRQSLGVGAALYSLVGAEAGQYVLGVAGTGAVQAATEEVFAVVESAFA